MTKLVKIFFNSSSIASNTYIDKLFFDTQITDSFFPSPFWEGKLTSKLNIENKDVTKLDLLSFQKYQNPLNNLELPIYQKKSSNIPTIYDFILSAPKSLSLLDSLFPNAYATIHHNAVNKVIELIESFAKVKISISNSKNSFDVITQKIAVTKFFHINGYDDKINLHTHIIILNLLSCPDDTYRLWNTKYFIEVLHNATLVYRNEIAKGLLEKNLKFDIQSTPWQESKSIEISSIPEKVLKEYYSLEKNLFNHLPYHKNTTIKEMTIDDYLAITSLTTSNKNLTFQEIYLNQTKSFPLSFAKKLLAIHKETISNKLVVNAQAKTNFVITSPFEMAKLLDNYAELIFRREVLYSFDFYIYCFFIFYFPGQVSFSVLHQAVNYSTKLMHITFNGIQSIVVTKKFYRQAANILDTTQAIKKSHPNYLLNTTKVNSNLFLLAIKNISSSPLPQSIVNCAEQILLKPAFLTVVTHLDNETFSYLLLAIAGVRKITCHQTPTFLISNDKVYQSIYKDLLPIKSLDFTNSLQYQFPDNSMVIVDPSIFNHIYDCFSLINNCSITNNIRIIFCQFYKEIRPFINSLWYYLKSIPNIQIINGPDDKHIYNLNSSNSQKLDSSKFNRYLFFDTIEKMRQQNLVQENINYLEEAANEYINTLKEDISNFPTTCVICENIKEQQKLNHMIQNKLDYHNILHQISLIHNRTNQELLPNLSKDDQTPTNSTELFPNIYKQGETFVKHKVSPKTLNNENYLVPNRTIMITQNITNFAEAFEVLTIESTSNKKVFFTNNKSCLKSRLVGKYIAGKCIPYTYQPGDLLINLFPIKSNLGTIPIGSQFIAMIENNYYKYLDPAWPTIGRIVEIRTPIFTLGYALLKDNLYNLKFNKTIVAISNLDDKLFSTLRKRTSKNLLFFTPNYLQLIEKLDTLTKEEEKTLSSISSLLAFDNDNFAILAQPLVLINSLLENARQRKIIERIAFGIKD